MINHIKMRHQRVIKAQLAQFLVHTRILQNSTSVLKKPVCRWCWIFTAKNLCECRSLARPIIYRPQSKSEFRISRFQKKRTREGKEEKKKNLNTSVRAACEEESFVFALFLLRRELRQARLSPPAAACAEFYICRR